MTLRDWRSVSGLHTVLRITPMLGFIIFAVFDIVFGRNEYWECACLTSLALIIPVLVVTMFTEIWIDGKIEEAKEATEK